MTLLSICFDCESARPLFPLKPFAYSLSLISPFALQPSPTRLSVRKPRPKPPSPSRLSFGAKEPDAVPPSSLHLCSRSPGANPTATLLPSDASQTPADSLSSLGQGSGSVAPTLPELSEGLKDIYKCCSIWRWKGYSVNFFVKGTGPPLLLVHGFGASIAHWRRNIGVLSENYTVYAIDLLGFGSSDKPLGFSYTMEVWSQLILDFLCEIIKKPTVLIGNSVGSLACVIAASEATQGMIRGIVLLNCAGGMNNKAIVDDWRIRLILPLFWLIDLLLKQRSIASAIFENVKKRENLKNILLSVYGNKESVDDDLIAIIKKPADDVGALDAFISIVTGPPGPNPVSLMPKVTVPVLLLWGDKDPFTPIDGPVGKYFSSLPSQLSNVNLYLLEGVGHCPHDDRPDLVHAKLLPWLASLPAI